MDCIRLVGLQTGRMDDESYRRAKTPAQQWQTATPLTEDQQQQWLAIGGWLGWRIPTGVIAVDIDDSAVADLLPVEGYYVIQTPRGRQYLFADTGSIETQRAGVLTRAGLVVDYRLAGRGYIVAPSLGMRQWGGGRERKILHEVLLSNLPPLPPWCMPVGVATAETVRFPLTEGQRNDSLFRHASLLRGQGLDVPAIADALAFANRYLCRPPLSNSEVAQIARSTARYEANETTEIIAPLERVGVPDLFSARALCEMILPPPNWLVEGLLPTGLALLVGKPKSGKSWLVLQLAIAVAASEPLCNHWGVSRAAQVLYLALEDNLRRLQRRLVHCSQSHSENLQLTTHWKPLRQGGLEQIDDYLSAHPNCGCVIVDTLQKVRGIDNPRINAYQADYDVLSLLKQIADAHNVAIIAVHHTRKSDATDWFDLVSGTTGMSGAADSLYYLERKRGESEARLYATGRDFEQEVDELLSWGARGWIAQGAAEQLLTTRTKQQIVDALKRNGQLRTAEIANAIGKPASSITRELLELSSAGLIERLERGVYRALVARDEVLL